MLVEEAVNLTFIGIAKAWRGTGKTLLPSVAPLFQLLMLSVILARINGLNEQS